jgi:hypothetical protein
MLTVLAVCLQAQPPALNQLEKDFQDSLTNVVLEGQSTRDGKESLSPDRYNIEKVVKTGEDTWTFYVKVNMQGREMTLPLPIDVKWAGDTPIITLTDRSLPGMGTYTARVVVYRGEYAGTWSGRNGGGKLFGKLTKSDAKPPATNGPCPLCGSTPPKP